MAFLFRLAGIFPHYLGKSGSIGVRAMKAKRLTQQAVARIFWINTSWSRPLLCLDATF